MSTIKVYFQKIHTNSVIKKKLEEGTLLKICIFINIQNN